MRAVHGVIGLSLLIIAGCEPVMHVSVIEGSTADHLVFLIEEGVGKPSLTDFTVRESDTDRIVWRARGARKHLPQEITYGLLLSGWDDIVQAESLGPGLYRASAAGGGFGGVNFEVTDSGVVIASSVTQLQSSPDQ